jgi:hypothetical protein
MTFAGRRHDRCWIRLHLVLNRQESVDYLRRTTREGETMETLELTWSQQKLREGKAAGIAEGDPRARRESVVELIRVRFGEPPADLTARIAVADTAELIALPRRAALANSIQELLVS